MCIGAHIVAEKTQHPARRERAIRPMPRTSEDLHDPNTTTSQTTPAPVNENVWSHVPRSSPGQTPAERADMKVASDAAYSLLVDLGRRSGMSMPPSGEQ